MGIFSDLLRRLVTPTGHYNAKVEQIKRAAAEDVAEIEKDEKRFGPNGRRKRQDDR